MLLLHVGQPGEPALAIDRATGDRADYPSLATNDYIALSGHAGVFLFKAESNQLGLPHPLVGHVGCLADEEWLVQLDVRVKARISRVQIERPGQFVAVQGQSGLDAQAIPRRQTHGANTQLLTLLQQRVPQGAGRGRMDKDLKGHRLTRVARSSQVQVIAGQPPANDLVPLHLEQRLSQRVGVTID